MKFYFTLILLLNFSFNIFSQENSNWDFPIKPGTEKWKTLTNQKMKVQACQIPESILVSIPTNDLIELSLKYPLLITILVQPSFQIGIDNIKKDFNGLSELFLRIDAPQLLLEKYNKMSSQFMINSESDSGKRQKSFNLLFLELFLSQDIFLSQLSVTERRQLLIKATEILRCKIDLKQSYSELSLNSSCLLITKLLDKEELSNFGISITEIREFKLYSNSAAIINENQFSRIIELSNRIISKL